MTSKHLSLYVTAMAAFFFVAIFSSYTGGQNTTFIEAKDSEPLLPQKVATVDLNRPYDFAGEALPMDNFDVRERLDAQLLRNAYFHSNTVMSIKRAQRVFTEIESILAENNLPSDLKYLAVAESSLTNAVSPAGAKGVWQFMTVTGKEYGLEITEEVDERYHLEKATRAACQYLKAKKERFGSWTLAAASYNMGSQGLLDEMKTQKMDNYYDLNLNQETGAYVFSIVALKELMMHPEAFGFYIKDDHKYQPLEFVNVAVDSSIENLGDFAISHGTTYRMLKVFNPWLISSKLTVATGRQYVVRIPKK